MNVILQFLHFRLKQMMRSIEEIGIPLIIIFLIVTLGLTFNLIQILSQVEGKIIGAISFFIIGSIHLSRKDESFLNHVNVSKTGLLFCEYNMFLIPVNILLLFFEKFEPALFWQFGWLPILLLPIGLFKKSKTVSFLSLEGMSNQYFELKAGFRKLFFIGSLTYLLALGCSFFIGTIVLFTLFILLILPTFFEYFEPKEIISNQYPNGFFLKNKVTQHLFYFQIMMLPHYVLFCFFHYQLWYFAVACFAVVTLMVIFCVVFKYASYRPSLPKHLGNSVHAVFFGTLILPGFVIVSVFLIIHFWRKAKKNLEYYYA